MSTLTDKQAYLAMFAFLESHYERTGSDDIGALLGDLSLAPDGAPADPAVTSDWAKAVAKAISGKVSPDMRLL